MTYDEIGAADAIPGVGAAAEGGDGSDVPSAPQAMLARPALHTRAPVPGISRLADLSAAGLFGTHPGVQRCDLQPAARHAAPVPHFLAGDADHALLEHIYAPRTTDALHCTRITDGYLAPTGVAVADGTAFFAESLMQPAHHVRRVIETLFRPDVPVRRIDGMLAVIYGPAHQTWGHWLCDYLPRLHVLVRCGYDLATLRFAVPPDLKPFAQALLARAGIGAGQLVRYAYGKEVLQAETLLRPGGFRSDDALASGFAAATAFWMGRMGFARPAARGARRIFLSRAGAAGERVVSNRSEIEALAAARGFDIIHPERMTLDDQLAAYADSAMIVGEYGSALHNAIFAGAGARVCALRGTSRHPGFVQTALCAAMGQQAGYVFGDTRTQTTEQRFRIEPPHFERALTWLLG